MVTTVGQILVNEGLPEPLQDYSRVLNREGIDGLLNDAYKEGPDAYRKTIKHLHRTGASVAQAVGSSFSLKDFIPPPKTKRKLTALRQTVEGMVNSNTSPEQIVKTVSGAQADLQATLNAESHDTNNAFAQQIESGSRGNPSQLRSLIAGDLLVLDHKGGIIPSPILRGYAEGLSPAEYFAASYGARRGVISTKFFTRDAGAWSKQVAQALHRVVATDEKPIEGVGLAVDPKDPDTAGYVLARDTGGLPEGTVLTPRLLKKLATKHKKLLVHSTVATTSKSGGIPRVAFGLRSNLKIPTPGSHIGVEAAQSLGEKLTQLQLSSKHTGGLVGEGFQESGFKALSNLVQSPKDFVGRATVASVAGRVQKIEEAPQGGSYVYIAGEQHYVRPGAKVTVKEGQVMEAGDRLAMGLLSPAELVKNKGIGEARRLFTEQFLKTYRASGVPIHRRNAEVLARGLLNHVRVTELDSVPGTIPGDVLEYDDVAARYIPRKGASEVSVGSSVGKYLEKPTLHYSIGTHITPSMAKHLLEMGVKTVLTHPEPPPFEPVMKRAMESLVDSPDWLARFGGSYQQKGLLEATSRGRSSPKNSRSFIPRMILGEL